MGYRKNEDMITLDTIDQAVWESAQKVTPEIISYDGPC